MSPCIKFLPAYLKAIDSSEIVSYLSSEEIETIRTICKESKQWQKDYNKAIKDYKTYHQRNKMSLYKSNGTLDITKWL